MAFLYLSIFFSTGCSGKSDAAKLGDPALTDEERRLVNAASPDRSADLRRAAVQELAAGVDGGDAVRLRLYRHLVGDEATDTTVAAGAALALAEHGGAGDAAAIAGLLDAAEPHARWMAATALQRVGTPGPADAAAAGPLIAALSDDDADVRTAAAVALGRYPQRDVYDALVQTLDDPDYGVVRAALDALATLTGREAEDDPAGWVAFAAERGAGLFDERRPYAFRRYEGGGGRWFGGGPEAHWVPDVEGGR